MNRLLELRGIDGRIVHPRVIRLRRTVTREQVPELLRGHRLFEDAEYGHSLRAGHRFHGREDGCLHGACQNDRGAKIGFGDVADEFHAVHAWHVEVADDDVERRAIASDQLERILAILGLQDLRDAQVAENLHRDPARGGLILHNHGSQQSKIHRETSVPSGNDIRF